MSRLPIRSLATAPIIMQLAMMAAACRGQSQSVLCDGGFGRLEWRSQSGVTVTVGALRNQGFAARACQAVLTWRKHQLVAATQDAQIDVDAAGVDLGIGAPALALQTRKLENDKFMRYEIYSLNQPPRQLRVITGGDWYSAADTDLDGQVEIWAGDAAAVDDFEEFPPSAWDFAAPIVLRFERERLMDVSAQFQPEYDRRIAALRARLGAAQLSAFKQSDGTLKALFPPTPMEWASLRKTKMIVLEIALCYLYSGRQHEAWSVLADTWPPSDLNRIRTAILEMRARGIAHQVDAVSTDTRPRWSRGNAPIYSAPLDKASIPAQQNPFRRNAPLTSDSQADEFKLHADSLPVQVLMRRPQLPVGADATLEKPVQLELVVDSAGKVRSASPLGHPDQDLLQSTSGWKFIPAFKNSRPVACRFRMEVTPAQ